MTEQTSQTQPRFFCPECGHKHRADLSGLIGHPGAHARVTCHRCGTTLKLHVDADGLPICEVAGEALAGHDEPAHHPAPASAPASAPAKAGGSTGLGGFVLALLAGAAGGFGAAQLAGGDSAAPPQAASTGPTRAEVEDLVSAALARREAALRADLGDAWKPALTALEQRLAYVTGRVDALPAAGATAQENERAAATAALAEELRQRLDQGLRSLNGRIEANYQAIKALERRADAPATPPRDE